MRVDAQAVVNGPNKRVNTDNMQTHSLLFYGKCSEDKSQQFSSSHHAWLITPGSRLIGFRELKCKQYWWSARSKKGLAEMDKIHKQASKLCRS